MANPLNKDMLISGGFNDAANDIGVGKLLGDQIAGPSTNASYAASGAGNLTGTYYYSVSYVTGEGETSPWSGTPAKITCASNSVALTSIPTGPVGVISRRIYRCVANETQDKRLYFVGTIADNTTMTYTDNLPDGSLGAAPKWVPTNYGWLGTATRKYVALGGQSISIGEGQEVPGYASVAIGSQSQKAGAPGLRNTSVGVYSLTSLTVGVENTALGTHAGQNILNDNGGVYIGYAAGFYVGEQTGIVDFNTVVGHSAMYGATGVAVGSFNTMIGFRAGYKLAAGSYCIGLGAYAGQWATADGQVFIDSVAGGRANLSDAQNKGLAYGEANATAKNQIWRFNALVQLGWSAAVVADLPTANAARRGMRGHVIDATVAYTSVNVGTTVVGGGSNVVPVFCNGSNWIIG